MIHALILDIDSRQTHIGVSCMEKIKFNKQFHKIACFHPFMTQNTLPHKVVQYNFQQHNIYQHDTMTYKIESVTKWNKNFKLKDGRILDVPTLFLLSSINKWNIFHGVSTRINRFYLLYDQKTRIWWNRRE